MTDDVDDGPWLALESLVATSHRVDKYGGIRLERSALEQIVDALNAGDLPMIGNHDWTKPVRTRDITASLVELPDGEFAVRLVGLVHADDWATVGEIGGMSFTTWEDLGEVIGKHPDAEPLRLAADPGWFSHDDIGEACSIMAELAPTKGSELLQFSAVDLARIAVEITASQISVWGPGIADNAVWDGLKYLLGRRRSRDALADSTPTRVELFTDLEQGRVTAVIDSSDPEQVREALRAYSGAVEAAARVHAGRSTVVWNGRGFVGPPGDES